MPAADSLNEHFGDGMKALKHKALCFDHNSPAFG